MSQWPELNYKIIQTKSAFHLYVDGKIHSRYPYTTEETHLTAKRQAEDKACELSEEFDEKMIKASHDRVFGAE